MTTFSDYKHSVIHLSEESYRHILFAHSEITLEMIQDTLRNPIEVRESNVNSQATLYYSLKLVTELKTRYICVVVKLTSKNELFIQTAMTTSSIKNGHVIFKKKD
jgi:hypothetical protein